MVFYIGYSILILLIYLLYLNNKLKWLIEIRMFIYKQCEDYVKKTINKSIEKLDTNDTLREEDIKKIENSTLVLTLEKLKLRSFYWVLFNPFRNNIYSNVENKVVLFNILKSNGFYS